MSLSKQTLVKGAVNLDACAQFYEFAKEQKAPILLKLRMIRCDSECPCIANKDERKITFETFKLGGVEIMNTIVHENYLTLKISPAALDLKILGLIWGKFEIYWPMMDVIEFLNIASMTGVKDWRNDGNILYCHDHSGDLQVLLKLMCPDGKKRPFWITKGNPRFVSNFAEGVKPWLQRINLFEKGLIKMGPDSAEPKIKSFLVSLSLWKTFSIHGSRLPDIKKVELRNSEFTALMIDWLKKSGDLVRSTSQEGTVYIPKSDFLSAYSKMRLLKQKEKGGFNNPRSLKQLAAIKIAMSPGIYVDDYSMSLLWPVISASIHKRQKISNEPFYALEEDYSDVLINVPWDHYDIVSINEFRSRFELERSEPSNIINRPMEREITEFVWFRDESNLCKWDEMNLMNKNRLMNMDIGYVSSRDDRKDSKERDHVGKVASEAASRIFFGSSFADKSAPSLFRILFFSSTEPSIELMSQSTRRSLICQIGYNTYDKVVICSDNDDVLKESSKFYRMVMGDYLIRKIRVGDDHNIQMNPMCKDEWLRAHKPALILTVTGCGHYRKDMCDTDSCIWHQFSKYLSNEDREIINGQLIFLDWFVTQYKKKVQQYFPLCMDEYEADWRPSSGLKELDKSYSVINILSKAFEIFGTG